MELKEWIHHERLNGRLVTIERVAKAVGISRWTLGRAINGRSDIYLSHVVKIHIMTDGKVSMSDWPLANKVTAK